MMLLSAGLTAQFTQSRQVTFRAHATVAPGLVFDGAAGVLYVKGDAELFLSNQASWRSDATYYLASIGQAPFRMNHGLYSGLCFRPTLKNFSPYVGLQPGVHLSQLNQTMDSDPPINFVPVISGLTGFHLYFSSFVHATMGMRVLHGTAIHNESQSLTEVRAWLGLGIHFTTNRRKFYDR